MITHHMEICRWFYWKLKWPPQVYFLIMCGILVKHWFIIYVIGFVNSSFVIFNKCVEIPSNPELFPELREYVI